MFLALIFLRLKTFLMLGAIIKKIHVFLHKVKIVAGESVFKISVQQIFPRNSCIPCVYVVFFRK